MGEQAQFIICSTCRAMTDAVTATPMWFVTDATVTPVRGYICGKCALVWSNGSEIVDTRTGDENGERHG